MSKELLEKLRDELTDHWNSADIVNGETQARIAIRAVLSHFAEAGNVTDGMQRGYENLFDPLSEVHTRKAAIAAAMEAALKEMEGT